MLSRYLSDSLAQLHKNTLYNSLQEKWRHCIRRKRQAWWDSQVRKREYFEKTIQRGVRMRLYFDSELSRLIYMNDFERIERQFLNAFLRPGDVFIDVGASIGLFSLIAAHCVGESGYVYSLEPTEKIYQRLIKNVNLNHFDNVFCFRIALSDKVGVFPLFASQDGFDAWNSLAQPIAGNSFSLESVETTTLDNFAQEHHLAGRVTMIKIDVEGWETRVLSHGSTTLARDDAPVLQVEFTDQAARSADSSCKQLYHKLQDLGYMMFSYDAKSRTLVPDPLRESYPYVNLIAAKQSQHTLTKLKEQSIRCLTR